MTLAELLDSYRTKRAAASAQMDVIVQTAATDARTLTTDEAAEFDTLKAQLAQFDADITRVEERIQAAVSAPAPVIVNSPPPADARLSAVNRPAASAGVNAPAVIPQILREDQFAGQTYTRTVIARAIAKLQGVSAVDYAQHRWGAGGARVIRALNTRRPFAANEVQGGTSTTWMSEAFDIEGLQDFITYLYSQTVFDKLGFRAVPPYITFGGQDGAATGYWVGEGRAIPLSTISLLTVSLTPLKAGALAVVSKETLRYATAASEMLVRDALVEAIAQRIDTTLLSTSAAVSGVSPAGLFNGVTPVASSGVDAEAVRADVRALFNAYITAKNTSGLTWIMHPSLAMSLSMMQTSLGVKEFPGIGMNGGTFFELPAIVGDNVPSTYLALVKPSDIWKVDDGGTGLEVSMSDQATVEMSSAPVANMNVPTGQTQNPVSMFQTEGVAFKVTRPFNYQLRRTHAVQYVNDAAYGTPATT